MAWLMMGCAMLLVSAGCGRKGPLETPASSATQPRASNADQTPASQRRNTPGNIYSIMDEDTGGGP